MFYAIWKLKARLSAFALSFAAGLLVVLVCGVLFGAFDRHAGRRAAGARNARTSPCGARDAFASPEQVAEAIRSDDVGVRREALGRLLVMPGLKTAYYDFERDRDFPERTESVRLQRLNLDDSPDDEALLTFVRVESPVAVVLKRGECGWKAVGAVSGWLKFEDFPYDEWLETREAVRGGAGLIVVRESAGDATSYTRRARVLGLVGGRLEELAEVEEESVAPVEGYAGADWPEVKRRRTAVFEFEPQTCDAPALMRVKSSEEVVRYSGVGPPNLYMREGDGAWHEARRHWRARRFEVLRRGAEGEEQFVWNEQKHRFVAVGL